MREMGASPGIKVERVIGVYAGNRTYHYDGLDVLPIVEFLKQLHQGKVF